MAYPIPLDFLERLIAHERWLETGKSEGKGLAGKENLLFIPSWI